MFEGSSRSETTEFTVAASGITATRSRSISPGAINSHLVASHNTAPIPKYRRRLPSALDEFSSFFGRRLKHPTRTAIAIASTARNNIIATPSIGAPDPLPPIVGSIRAVITITAIDVNTANSHNATLANFMRSISVSSCRPSKSLLFLRDFVREPSVPPKNSNHSAKATSHLRLVHTAERF